MPNATEPGNPVTTSAASQTHRAESKRDRKRQLVLDKLSLLEDNMARDSNAVYRDQLQRISLEVGLAQRFDPFALDCLDKIADLRVEYVQAVDAPPLSENGRSLLDMSGPTFSNYLDLIEDATEKRDFALVEHKREHAARLARHKYDHDHKVQTVIREHDYLANTIRDRLINQIATRKARLIKEKEALELSEATALLNPGQFSIANPASPGGPHGKRATRMRRDVDEQHNNGYPEKKRKRHVDEDDSPAPLARGLDLNNTTSLWQSDKLRSLAKEHGSPFSVERLFTEKELVMAHNSAAVSTHQDMLQSRVSFANGADASTESSSDSDVDHDSNNSNSGNNGNGSDGRNLEPPSSSAPMERQISHATRSTRIAADEKALGPETVANFELPASLKKVFLAEPPKLPPYVLQPYMRPYPRTNEPMTTTSLPADEISADMAAFNVVKWYSSTHKAGEVLDNIRGLKDVLRAAAMPVSEARYELARSQEDESALALRSTAGATATATATASAAAVAVAVMASRPANGGGAIPMSRQSSLGTLPNRQDGARGKGGKGR